MQLTTGILHNVAQEEENVPELREIGVIEASKPYLESHVDMRRLSCLAILADLVNEQESQLLQSNSDSIAFLIKCLNTAVAQETRRSNGWSAREIARSKFFAATIYVVDREIGEIIQVTDSINVFYGSELGLEN